MCSALEELMADVIAEREKEAIERGLNRGMAQGIEQGMAQGMAQGITQGEMRKLIELVCKKLKKNKTPDCIAEELEEEQDIIRNICEMATMFAPDYKYDEVYKVWEGEQRRGEQKTA